MILSILFATFVLLITRACGSTRIFDLKGRTALVTGASGGIGSQQAKALASAGADVILLGRNGEKLEKVKEEIQVECASTRSRTTVAAVVGDISDLTKLDALLEKIFEASPTRSIDILCNTAGENPRVHADELTFESWDSTLNLNLKVPFFLAQKLVPKMKQNGWGKIINVASLQSERAFPNGLAYGASKGGVAQLTRAMAEVWSSYGISCNAIAPGFFETGLTASVFAQEELQKKLAAQTCMGRNGRLEDINGVTIFLASRSSDYITGQVIYLDGGFVAK